MNTLKQTLECLVCSNIWLSIMYKSKDAQGNECYVGGSCCRVCGFDENVVVDTGEEAASKGEVAQRA